MRAAGQILEGRPMAMWIRVLVLAVMLAMPSGAAWAHASLHSTVPADGSTVGEAPKSLSLTFSELVAPLSLRLIRPDGTALVIDRFKLRDGTVEIEPPADLGAGTHVLSWRVVSADGHPIGGSVVFSIGAPSAQAPLVEEAVDWDVRRGLWLSKIALYLGLFLGVGGVFARRALMPDVAAGRRVVLSTLALGVAGATLSAGFQGLDALGAPAGRLAEPIVWSTGLSTSYGRTVWAALVALALAGLALAARGGLARMAAVAALLAAAAALALSGHASAAAPQWLMRPAVFLHSAAVAVWIGALAPLGLALKRGEPGAAAALRRFSMVIPAVVGPLVVAGGILTFVQVERPAALIDTAYGQVLSVKLALLAGLFALAAYNRWRLTGPVAVGDPSATRRLARTIAAETAIAIAIFAAVAMWRFTPPPRVLAEKAALPEFVHIHTQKAMADITVTPGRAGPVAVSIMVMTGDFGPLDPKEVSLVLANPAAGIEPIKRRATRTDDGRWRVEGLLLPLAGAWELRVDVLISDFEMVRLDSPIQIRP
jgi:copper transport protein